MNTLLIIAGGIILYAVCREAMLQVQKRKARPAGFTGAGPTRLVEALTDPREAAAVLLVQVAMYGGQVSLADKDRISELMQGAFAVTPEEAEGLFSFGRMAVGQLGDASKSLNRLLRAVHENCTLAEMNDLGRMIQAVADVDGPANAAQRRFISQTRRALKLSDEPA